VTPMITATLDPPSTADPQHAYTLHLTIGPPAAEVDYVARVDLQTNEPKLQPLSVIITGVVRQGPVASPSAVVISSLDRNQVDQELQHVLVQTRSGPFHLLKVESG